MNTKTSLKLALGTTMAAGIALGTTQAFAENPFSAEKLSSGYLQLAENKSSDMKCGAGICGGNAKKAATEGEECPADTDKDGKVSKEEFLTQHSKMFDAADANKDGSLDADERKAMHKMMGEGKCGGMSKDTAQKVESTNKPEVKPDSAPVVEEKK